MNKTKLSLNLATIGVSMALWPSIQQLLITAIMVIAAYAIDLAVKKIKSWLTKVAKVVDDQILYWYNEDCYTNGEAPIPDFIVKEASADVLASWFKIEK